MSTSQSKFQGLNDEEVIRSREQHGENMLTPPEKESIWKLYLEKFKDPVIKVLLFAAVLSLGISVIENEYAETIGIIFAILLATGIGFYFEYDAGKKFDLLNAVGEETQVKVIRGGKVHSIPRREVVVDDIVIIENGEEIPADGVLLEATSLQINESSLTGELMVEKTTNPDDFDTDATYASNLVMRGNTVTDGHGVMRVVRVGDATEIGKVARQSTEASEEETPLNKQLTRLASLIGKVGFTIAGVTFVVFVARDLYSWFTLHGSIQDWHQGMEVVQIVLKYFMMAVTLIVVSVPEGLPMSVTLSLALNMRRMLATNNLVRKMHACETMGAVTVICTDKTGTLTQNKMQVYETQFPALATHEELITNSMAVNSTAFIERKGEEELIPIGNPTEGALLLWLHKQGHDYELLREESKVISQLPFSTERKYMATLAEKEGKRTLYIKGAPEIILRHSKTFLSTEEKICPIESYRATAEEQLMKYQNMAMRTLGFAIAEVDEKAGSDCEELVANSAITFLGIAAISDPIRPDVPAAVGKCQSAGIDIKIVTGDTPGTATEIARQIGLWKPEDTDRNRITGVEFAALSDEEALDRVMDLKIMSRARPTDKQRLVQLLQQRGAVVAVTGDGTNDAPALNHAQVGLSMGTGTSVAKEASDITLLDDSFNSIGTAVMWGRSLYKNIQRFIAFQLTINVVALAIVLLGAVMGTAIPLTVTQMLWINLIMDTFAAMALASIPPSESVMKQKPRKSTDFIITPAMYRNIGGMGLLFVGVLVGLYLYMNANALLDLKGLTVVFTIFVMMQFWNLFNARVLGTDDSAFKGFSKSYTLWIVATIILGGQFIIVQWGGNVFRTTPLDWQTWMGIIASTSVILWVGEIVRLIKRITSTWMPTPYAKSSATTSTKPIP
ncbi:MAG: calcium-translocating P-type ATPase, PMCA-type [Bacteroidaceae bacterium]|nr:calcium-translocating P-type ATPase, PMCA-type [Bacteroidaceae bacterium]